MHLQTPHQNKTSKKPKGPLRTHREIADLFGVHPSVLNHIMGTAKVPPPPPFAVHKCRNTGMNHYYELFAMQAWWREYQKLKEAA